MQILKNRQDMKDAEWADDKYYEDNLKKRSNELAKFIENITKVKVAKDKIKDK